MNASSSLSDYRQFMTNTTTNYPPHCYCGNEAILKEVRAETPNKGRFFWSCKKYGGQNHATTCSYFQWYEASDESSSMAQNRSSRSEIPFVLVEPNNNNNINDKPEVNSSPDQLSVNMLTRRNRNSNGSTSLPQAPGSRPQSPSPSNTANGTVGIATITAATTTANIAADTNNTDDNETNDTHNDARTTSVTGNLTNDILDLDIIPKYTTPQLLDIVKNHIVLKDENYKKWYNATKSVESELEEAKKEVERLKKDLKDANRENNLYIREKGVLESEKRLLENENNNLKVENQELKRRRY